MAKIKPRRIYWNASTSSDVVSRNVYVAPGGSNIIQDIDSGALAPHVNVPNPEWNITGLPEGNYDFAVAAVDDAGNESDPYQHPDWVNVPLDVTPPAPPSGGGID